MYTVYSPSVVSKLKKTNGRANIIILHIFVEFLSHNLILLELVKIEILFMLSFLDD